MTAGFIITAAAVLACLGIYQLMKDRDAKSSNKVYPLSRDDAALQEYYRRNDAVKVASLRSAREASRRRYEGITWPAICWAYHERQIRRTLASGYLWLTE